MCFYWLWDGPLFIYLVTDKTVSSGQLRLERLFQYMHNTRRCQCYRWNPYIFCILLRHTDAQRSKLKQGILQRLSIFRPLKNTWQTFWFPAWSREQLCTNQTRCWLLHGLKATTRMSSFNHSPPLHWLLNKRSGAATSRRDCKAWPCNCLDHFHHKMAGLASHRRLKNIFGCKLSMKRGFYLKSGTDLHCDITHW